MCNVISLRPARNIVEPLTVIEACGVVGSLKVSVTRGKPRLGIDPIVVVVDGGRSGRRIVGRFKDTEADREQAALLADVVIEALALAQNEWCPASPRAG